MKNMLTNKRILLPVIILSAAVAMPAIYARLAVRQYTLTVTDAMDTVSAVTIRSGFSSKRIARECADIIYRYDKMLSVDNPQSEISRFNRSAAGSDFSEATYNMLKECGRLYADTDTGFDITVGAVSRLWASSFLTQTMPDEEKLSNAAALTGYPSLSFDDKTLTITKSIPKQELTAGAVAKGFIADKIADYLTTEKTDGALIDLGGNIYVCGNNGRGEEWKVGIQNPDDSSALIGQIRLHEGFVITSGDYQRYMISDGIRYHHILNAVTGYPAKSGLRSVTIVSDSGFTGDALSTACFIAGLDGGIKLAQKYDVGAVFVTDGNEVFYSRRLENTFSGKSEGYTYTAF